MAVVSTDALSRWYGDVIAVNNVTVAVQPGITGLLGPNGAGKSSFMRMIMGLLRPSSGTIEVLGQTPWNNTKLLSRLGYVGEGDAPWREETGHKAAVLAGRLAGLDPEAAEDAAGKALQQVGLTDVAQRVVDGYSRGMRQRLKFAMALLHDPELYILDEPLLGTDPMTRRDLIALIKDLEKRGKSVLVSTHVLSDVEAMTQRILLLNRGRLMAYGEVPQIRDLLERYPRTVRIATADPRGLGQHIWAWPSVLSLEAANDSILVKTKKPADFYADLQRLLANGEIPFTSVTSPDDNVEAVFRYLVE